MKPIDTADFETRIITRPLTAADYEAVCRLQPRCVPEMLTWKPEQFASQLEHFPEGQLCIEVDGVIVESSASLILDYDL